MGQLVKLRQAKSFHKQYIFQAMVHFEIATWHIESPEDFWLPVFVETRELTEEEKAICEEFDRHVTCFISNADWSFLERACNNMSIKREKIRQFALILSFMRVKGEHRPVEIVARESLWMPFVDAIGCSHSAGPAYWCSLADNIRHLMRSMGCWDIRHKISF
jgi:hypothetical protein